MSMSADLSVRIAEENHIVSRTMPAVSLVENPPLWNSPGWANVAASLASCVGAYKIHIFPFGLLDPWESIPRGRVEARPSLWANGNRLITAIRKIRECSDSAPIILTLFGACWWMKGQLHNNNGNTTLMTFVDRYSTNGRVMRNHLDEWLMMVNDAVRLVAAAGGRDFEVWNEAKGYYSVPTGKGQTWDASYDAGHDDHADMGYSYFYKATADQVVATMAKLGIARNQYRLGGPYPVLSTRGAISADAIANNHPLYAYGDQWGYANKAPINFTREFLGHAWRERFEFDVLTLSLSTSLQSGNYPSADPFAYSAKVQHVTRYWRNVLAEVGFDRDLPVDFGELYAFPLPARQTPGNGQLRAAMWADCLKHCVVERVRYPIIWGAVGSAQGRNSNEGGLVTNPALGTVYGKLTLTGQVVRFFKEYFGDGQSVYTIASSDARIDGLASTDVVLLYNKSADTLNVNVTGKTERFEAYEVKLLEIA